MEFLLPLAVAGVLIMLAWKRSGRTWRQWWFFRIVRGYVQLWHRWRVMRPAVLPAAGPVLFISNHTCSSDPTFLQTAFDERVLCWLSSREHYESHPLVSKLLDDLQCVRVRRDGRDAVAARHALARLRHGHALCIFPEGNLSGVALGRSRMAKYGAAWLALHSGATVVPAFISGGPQTHRLVRSWVVPSARAVRVHVGNPLDLRAFRGRPVNRRLLHQVSHFFMEQVQSLAPRQHRRGKEV